MSVRVAATPHAEAALIADALRRAHLIDGVPWSQMAVIVRSVPQAGAALAAGADRGGCAGGTPRRRARRSPNSPRCGRC